jgi:hypothetical protein
MVNSLPSSASQGLAAVTDPQFIELGHMNQPGTTPDNTSETTPTTIEHFLKIQHAYIKRNDTSQDPKALLWIESLFPAVIALASFGGSITFSVIPSSLENSQNHRIDKQEVRNFLALAWLFFALALGIASTGQLALTFHRDIVKMEFNKERTLAITEHGQRLALFLLYSFPISLLLQVLILLAFLFLALVIAAYAPAVGWTAVGFTSSATLLAIAVWFFQSYEFTCKSPFVRQKEDKKPGKEAESDDR